MYFKSVAKVKSIFLTWIKTVKFFFFLFILGIARAMDPLLFVLMTIVIGTENEGKYNILSCHQNINKRGIFQSGFPSLWKDFLLLPVVFVGQKIKVNSPEGTKKLYV